MDELMERNTTSTYSDILLQKVISNRDKIHEICSRRGFNAPRVFGSVAKGTADTGSDIDILVSLNNAHVSYFAQGGLLVEIEELLGVPVDIVVDTEIREEAQENILGGRLYTI